MTNLEKKLDKMDRIDGMKGGRYECNIRNLSSLEPTNLLEVSNYISQISETFDIKDISTDEMEHPYIVNTFIGNLRTNLKIQLEDPKKLKGLDLQGKLNGIKDEGSIEDALRCISSGYRWNGKPTLMYLKEGPGYSGPGGPGNKPKPVPVAVPVLSNEKFSKGPQVEKPKRFPGIVFNLEPKYIESDYQEFT